MRTKLNPSEIAAQAAERTYKTILHFSEFDEKITYYDCHSAKWANIEIAHCFRNHEFRNDYFNASGDYFLEFYSLIHGDIRLRYDNKEAILVAQNAVEAFECALRINQLA